MSELEPKVKKSQKKGKVDYEEDLKKRGIVYISRISPGMKPMKVKHLMSQFGEVTRIFCKPEGIYHFTSLTVRGYASTETQESWRKQEKTLY